MSSPREQISARKSHLRTHSLARRADRTRTHCLADDMQILDRVLRLSQVRAASRCFAYISVCDEVDTRCLIAELESARKQILVPSITRATGMQAVRFDGWHQLRLGTLNIPEPQPGIRSVPEAPPCVAIVPGLCFTERGHRLGYGGGYYDRWLALHPTTISIGIFRDDDWIEDLPIENHDIALDLIVTPSRVLNPNARYL